MGSNSHDRLLGDGADIGEALAACRCDLLLPSDNFDNTMITAFLKIRKPKTRRRGKGRVQHAKLE